MKKSKKSSCGLPFLRLIDVVGELRILVFCQPFLISHIFFQVRIDGFPNPSIRTVVIPRTNPAKLYLSTKEVL